MDDVLWSNGQTCRCMYGGKWEPVPCKLKSALTFYFGWPRTQDLKVIGRRHYGHNKINACCFTRVTCTAFTYHISWKFFVLIFAVLFWLKWTRNKIRTTRHLSLFPETGDLEYVFQGQQGSNVTADLNSQHTVSYLFRDTVWKLITDRLVTTRHFRAMSENGFPWIVGFKVNTGQM